MATGSAHMPTLLVVDNERNVLYSLKKGLKTDKVKVITAETAEAGPEAIPTFRPSRSFTGRPFAGYERTGRL